MITDFLSRKGRNVVSVDAKLHRKIKLIKFK